MSLYELIKTRKHRTRLKEILHVFYEEEFGYLLSKIDLHKHLPFKKRIIAKIARDSKTSPPKRLRHAFERLGPTFIKFGQLLSLRPDLIPPEYVAEFEKMQDKVPQFPFHQAKKIIEKELGKPINKVFTQFDKKPVASASISQVYKAKIGKETVAVKVQRPNIQKILEEDIEIMYKIAELLEEHFPNTKEYHIRGTIHEFEKWTIKELNFRIEAYYAQKIAKNFKGSKILKVPKINTKLSTSNILIMEYLEGIPLHNIEELKKKKINIEKIIKNGYYIALKQVFVDGFFHADPHPGNLLVLPGDKIGLIDFGILGHFDKKLKRDSLGMLKAFISNNPEGVIEILLNMNPENDIDVEAFSNDIRDIFEELQVTPVEELKIGSLVKEAITTANKHKLRIPEDFVLYGKTLAIVEGIALRYQPDFDFNKETKAVFKKILNFEFFTKEAIDLSTTKLFQYKDLVDKFPETALAIMEKAKKFQLNIGVEEKDIKMLSLEMEKSSGNIAFGFIIAALIVGAALVMQTDKWPMLSSGLFLIAAGLGIWLIHRTLFVKIKDMFVKT
tara:strand:+ start:153 stop:1826 length:1674 start_codon:yes stop_codon:yes gene_type:complete